MNIKMANSIEIFQGNTKTIVCAVTGLASLTGYTATLTVKKEARDVGIPLISVTGTIEALNITFLTSATNNTLPAGKYVYEVSVTDGTNVYTIVQDVYEILESAKY